MNADVHQAVRDLYQSALRKWFGVGASLWNADERVVFLVSSLDQEVRSGGFDAYFYEATSDHFSQSTKALEQIGATRHLAVVNQAGQLFPDGVVPKRFSDRARIVEDWTNETKATLQKLDQAYVACDVDEDIDQLLIRFVTDRGSAR